MDKVLCVLLAICLVYLTVDLILTNRRVNKEIKAIKEARSKENFRELMSQSPTNGEHFLDPKTRRALAQTLPGDALGIYGKSRPYPTDVDPAEAQKQMREMTEEYCKRIGVPESALQCYPTDGNKANKKPTITIKEPAITIGIVHGVYYGDMHGNPITPPSAPREEKIVNPPIELPGPENKEAE